MKNKPKFRPNQNLRLMNQVREILRYHHYAYCTEQTCCQWILRYIHYFGGKTRWMQDLVDKLCKGIATGAGMLDAASGAA